MTFYLSVCLGPLPEATPTKSDQIRPNPIDSDQIRPIPTNSDNVSLTNSDQIYQKSKSDQIRPNPANLTKSDQIRLNPTESN